MTGGVSSRAIVETLEGTACRAVSAELEREGVCQERLASLYIVLRKVLHHGGHVPCITTAFQAHSFCRGQEYCDLCCTRTRESPQFIAQLL